MPHFRATFWVLLGGIVLLGVWSERSGAVTEGRFVPGWPPAQERPLQQQFSSPEDGPSASADVVSLRSALSKNQVRPGDSVRAAVVLQIDEGWHINAHRPTLDYLVGTEVKLSSDAPVTVLDTRYPPAKQLRFAFASDTLDVYEGEAIVLADLHIPPEIQPGSYVLNATTQVQACNDRICLRPSTMGLHIGLPVVGPNEVTQAAHQELFTRAEEGTMAVSGTGPSGNEIAQMFQERGWLAFLSIFVIGLALNLTPCVYPMLSVTVSLFSEQAQDSLGGAAASASIYVLGIATMYSVLGVAAAFTGSLFGAWLQSPWVLGGIGVLLLALAASLFGAYEIQVPYWVRERLGGVQQGTGFAGMYASGILVGVFAAPCVGPLVIALLAFVGQQGDPVLGLVSFFVLSLGLGLPYLVLGTFSGLLTHLPRSGQWMVWVKKLLGVVIVGAGLFYLGLALRPDLALWVVPATLVIGGIYIGFLARGQSAGPGLRYVRWTVGVLAVLAGVYAVQNLRQPAIEWEPYTDQRLEQARASGQPVMLDFYADWCIPCLELQQRTFTDPSVRERAEEFVTLKVDLTRYESPEAQAVRERFGVTGLPTVVFLNRQGQEVRSARVTGFVGPDAFLDHLSKVHSSGTATSSQ